MKGRLLRLTSQRFEATSIFGNIAVALAWPVFHIGGGELGGVAIVPMPKAAVDKDGFAA